MFHEERETVPDDVAALRGEYAEDLAAAIESVGVESAAERTGLDVGTLEDVLAAAEDPSALPDLALSEAAAIQSLVEGVADPDTVVEIACDHLLLGMSVAVLDVDTVAGELDIDLTPKEIQQKLERRAPMTFAEYVAIQHVIASRRP